MFRRDEPTLVNDKYTYYLLTNNHVVYKKLGEYQYFDYSVRDCYGKTYVASLVAHDADYDLAIVKFYSDKKYNKLSFATSNPKKSDIVISIGQPNGIINTVTLGKVEKYMVVTIPEGSGLIDTNIINVSFNVIRHTCLLNHGSSGGVLINVNHKIVGLNFAADLQEGDEFVPGYAIPVEKIKEFIQNYQGSLE